MHIYESPLYSWKDNMPNLDGKPMGKGHPIIQEQAYISHKLTK